MYKRHSNYSAGNPVQNSLSDRLRQLWTQHVMWTRSFIISTAANLGDLQLVTKRLLQNPDDFAKIFMPFYGGEKANKLKDLLTQHLMIAGDLVNALKAGNTASADEIRRKWYQNAADLAEFLSEINPYWSRREWESMLDQHLQNTEAEATYRLNSQYASDIAMYDEVEDQALEMADYMTTGIKRQFRL